MKNKSFHQIKDALSLFDISILEKIRISEIEKEVRMKDTFKTMKQEIEKRRFFYEILN